MTRNGSIKWSFAFAVVAGAAIAWMPGCELIVDFDRSKIPVEGGLDATTTVDGPSAADQAAAETGDDAEDAGGDDSTTPGNEGSAPDAGGADAGGAESGSEPAPEAGPEAAPEPQPDAMTGDAGD